MEIRSSMHTVRADMLFTLDTWRNTAKETIRIVTSLVWFHESQMCVTSLVFYRLVFKVNAFPHFFSVLWIMTVWKDGCPFSALSPRPLTSAGPALSRRQRTWIAFPFFRQFSIFYDVRYVNSFQGQTKAFGPPIWWVHYVAGWAPSLGPKSTHVSIRLIRAHSAPLIRSKGRRPMRLFTLHIHFKVEKKASMLIFRMKLTVLELNLQFWYIGALSCTLDPRKLRYLKRPCKKKYTYTLYRNLNFLMQKRYCLRHLSRSLAVADSSLSNYPLWPVVSLSRFSQFSDRYILFRYLPSQTPFMSRYVCVPIFLVFRYPFVNIHLRQCVHVFKVSEF